MKKKKQNNFLTVVELEFMTHLWELGQATVRDILARLAPDRNLAYTSGATIMRILEQKKFITSSKRGKTLVYRPLLAKDAYQARSLRDMSEKLFDNAPVSLVARLVDDTDLSEEVLAEMRELLDRRLRNNGNSYTD